MRTAIALVLVAAAMVSNGCSLCNPGYLCDYAGVGGKWQRNDPENGRVGSILSDPNTGSPTGGQVSEVIVDPDVIYEDDAINPNSVLEPTMKSNGVQQPTSMQSTEEGVIILGDQW